MTDLAGLEKLNRELVRRIKKTEKDLAVLRREILEGRGRTDGSHRTPNGIGTHPGMIQPLDMAVMKITAGPTTGDTYTARRQRASALGSWAAHPDDTDDYTIAFSDGSTDAAVDDIVLARFDLITSAGVVVYHVYSTVGVDGTHVSPYAVQATTFETEAADAKTWDITSPPAATDGVTVRLQTRTAYDDSSDEKLYGYYRDLTFDSVGKLVAVSAETRVTIDTPEECS